MSFKFEVSTIAGIRDPLFFDFGANRYVHTKLERSQNEYLDWFWAWLVVFCQLFVNIYNDPVPNNLFSLLTEIS